MKKIVIICLILFGFFLTGCSKDNKNSDSSSSSTKSTAKFYSAEEAQNKLLEFAITAGDKDSKAVIIEATDFECPACRHWHQEFKKIIDEFSDRVLFGYVAYPLNYHPNAMPASLAAEAAAKQGKGWEAYKYFFDGNALDTNKIDTIADDLSLNKSQYEKDLKSSDIEQKISDSMKLLNELKLTGTPTFFINGIMFKSAPNYENLKAEIEKLL